MKLPPEIVELIFNYLETDEILDLLANDSSLLDKILLQTLKIKNKGYYDAIVNKNYFNYPNELLNIFIITKNDVGINYMLERYKLEFNYNEHNNLFFEFKNSNDYYQINFTYFSTTHSYFFPFCVYIYKHDFSKVEKDLNHINQRHCIDTMCSVFEHACCCGYLGIAKFIYYKFWCRLHHNDNSLIYFMYQSSKHNHVRIWLKNILKYDNRWNFILEDIEPN